MKDPRKIIVLFAVFFVLLFSAGRASACFCLEGVYQVKDYVGMSENIAIFKVISLDRSGPAGPYYQAGGVRRIKLKAERVFKGKIKPGQVATFSQGSGTDCLWVFRDADIGKTFLFYLHEPMSDGTWVQATCLGSGRTEETTTYDIGYLEKIKKAAGKKAVKHKRQ